MIRWGIVAAGLLLQGCGFTAQGDFVRGAVENYGAQAYDEGLVNAEFFMCKSASVGSVVRRYGVSIEKWEAWQELCLTRYTELDIPEKEEE